jgi:myosin XV
LSLLFPDNSHQTVAIDQWTTCEEAAGLSLAMLTQGFQTQGWTVTMEDNGIVTDTCGLDYVLDLVGEKELLPAFPAIKNDLFKTKGKIGGPPSTPTRSSDIEPTSPVKKRPQNKPPDPPYQRNSNSSDIMVTTDQIVTRNSVDKMQREEIHAMYAQRQEGPGRKNSIDLLSRSSALNERYFEIEKSRSRSLDNLINSDSESTQQAPEIVVEPLMDLGLSQSKLNERYHSVERLAPLKQPAPRHLKPPPVGKRMDSYGKFMERNEMLIRSSAMSDTSEAPSLASHVRRLRVPSQASDVDQFLDDLFSPVLDTQLDELSDARSLAASIRGGDDYCIYSEAPIILNDDLNTLENANLLCRVIKGGGSDEADSMRTPLPEDKSLDEYITDLFQPIFLNENIRNLGEKEELADAIKGGAEDSYQQHVQRQFLESAMQQNLQIQQQLMAQNQALQTLLLQQAEERAQGGSKSGQKSQSIEQMKVRLNKLF